MHLSQEPHYIHDETSDTSTNSDLTHIHGHGCVPENDVSITTDTEEQIGEATEMMDMAADSKYCSYREGTFYLLSDKKILILRI
jgi:hypothetical protein